MQLSAGNIEMLGGPRDKVKLSVLIKALFITFSHLRSNKLLYYSFRFYYFTFKLGKFKGVSYSFSYD